MRAKNGPAKKGSLTGDSSDGAVVTADTENDGSRTVQIDLRLTFEITRPGDLAACVAVGGAPYDESLVVLALRGVPALVHEVRQHRARTHVVALPTGQAQLTYRSTARLGSEAPEPLGAGDALVYRRPSRYCPSDQIAGLAAAMFGELDPLAAVLAVEAWIHDTVAYVPGVTDVVDDALHPLLARTGVCRDFAHLAVAMCRALGIPARYTAAYAPGLDPMDFHAVFEAAIDDHWYVFDATRLVPRQTLVRISTGRDAADVALLTPLGAAFALTDRRLTVTAEPTLPVDDHTSLVPMSTIHVKE